MDIRERLSIQSKNLTALMYRALGIHPEKGEVIHQALNDSWPEEWIPLKVEESFTVSGGIEVQARDLDGKIVTMNPGNWADRERTNQLWEIVVPFLVESSRGIELFVGDNNNTMVYVPKCKLMISTGLPDGSVMKAITSNSGNLQYTKCPISALSAGECRYPYCLGAMVTTPQPSIKAAKTAYRDSVCVALTRNSQGNKMLFLTNGANHLNLVNLDQAVETAWSVQWLLNLRGMIEQYGFEEPEQLNSKLASMMEVEDLRLKQAEELFKDNQLEIVITEEIEELPENVSVKEKRAKTKGRKKKVEADLSELDPDSEIEIKSESVEEE